MDTPSLVHAFRALHSSTDRAAAIAALTHELSPYEWRQLHALLDARSFHLDIVGNLPPELVFHIFSHLDISTPFRLQSVSYALQCNAMQCKRRALQHHR